MTIRIFLRDIKTVAFIIIAASKTFGSSAFVSTQFLHIEVFTPYANENGFANHVRSYSRDDNGSDDCCIDEESNHSIKDYSRQIATDGHEIQGHETVQQIIDVGNDGQIIREYFATCIPGLQNILASELITLGAIDVVPTGTSGVSFAGNSTIGLKSILWCRTAHKVMELIASSPFSTPVRNSGDLYEFTKASIHTPSLLGNGQGGLMTLSVNTIYTATVPKELCHGHFTALTVKNALVDAVRELRDDGDRPDVDVEDSDVPLVAVF